MARDADGENGPAARSFAADAHDCIMVRIQSGPTPYKFVARTERCAPWQAPLGSFCRQAPSHAELGREADLAVHRPAARSGVKALPNTSDAKQQVAKLC